MDAGRCESPGLYDIWWNAENRVVIAAKGAIEAVVRAMGAHESSAGVQVAGCSSLLNLALNAENRAAIGTHGGIEAVVRAMTAHGSSEEVQENGCAALINLAFDARNQVAIAGKGGTEAVVRAMAAHESSVKVQEAGCGALAKIVLWESGLHSEVLEAAAVPLVKKALSAFPYNWGLQTRGRFFLMKLGAWSAFRFRG